MVTLIFLRGLCGYVGSHSHPWGEWHYEQKDCCMMFLCRWTLTEDESYTTFEVWRTNLMTILAYEEAFTPFLKPDVTWGRKTKTSPLRGFHGSDAAQQVTTLETMLGLIANHAPVISWGKIVKNCTSLNVVWKALHLYNWIQSSDDTHHLPNSKTLHQSDEPSYQDYSMCKSARKSNHDIQQYLQRTKLFWKAVSQRFRVLLLIATFSVLMMRVASPIWIHLIFPCYHKIVNSLYQIH